MVHIESTWWPEFSLLHELGYSARLASELQVEMSQYMADYPPAM